MTGALAGGLLIGLALIGCRSGGAGAEPAAAPPAQNGQASATETEPQPADTPTPEPAPAQVDGPEEPVAAPPSEPPPTLEEALAYDPADPLKDLEKADVLDRGMVAAELSGPCRYLVPPQRVWPVPGQLAITAAGGEFVIAGYVPGKRGGEQVFVVRVGEQGLPKPLRTFKIDPPHPTPRKAGPGLAARDGNQVSLAVTDGTGALSITDVPLSSAGAASRLRAIASGVDTRFAPAIDHVDAGTLVAYTLGTTPMQTHVALVPADDKPPKTTNVTPSHVGAAAPAFVVGAYPPKLYVIDARDGMSPLLEVSISAQGVPRVAEIVTPVGMVASPTKLAVARTTFGTALAYVGIGSALTSAVGLIDVAPKPGSPIALVKGTAYGPLSVAAANGPDALYFAADAPREPGAKAPKRELHVVRVAAGGLQERTVIQGPGGDAYGVAMARNGAGTVAVAFDAADGAYIARLHCR